MTSGPIFSQLIVGLFLVGVATIVPATAGDTVFPIGGRIGLSPPGAMKPGTTVRGFEDRETQSSILILEMPVQANSEVERELMPANVKQKGIVEERRETLSLGIGAAVLIVGEQESDGQKLRKWILFVSAADMSALIAVQVPDAARSAYPDAEIRATLASVTARAVVPMAEQLQLLPFKLDELSGLRPFRVVGPNSVLLTEGPKDTVEAAEQPLLAVAIAAGGPEDAANRNNFARSLFTGFSAFKTVRITGSDLLKLPIMPTHEIQADALDAKTDAPMKLVQWVGFGNGAIIRIVGMARADTWAQAFPRFRAVRDGLKPRR